MLRGMSNEIAVRGATRADLPRVGAFAGRLVREHHDADPARFFLPEGVEQGYAWWLGKELANAEAQVLVAERAGQLVGYSYAALRERDWNMLLDEHAMLHDIFVASEARRQGVGHTLLAATLEALEARGAKRIVLSTRQGNESAERLFAKMGFRRTMIEMTRASR